MSFHRTKGDLGLFDEQHIIVKPFHRLQIVVAGDQQAPLGRQFLEKPAQVFLCGLVQAGERLIQQQHVRFLSQGTREEGSLLLTSGKGADLTVLKIQKVHGCKRPLHDVSVVT